MTPIIVVTTDDKGYAYIYYRNGDGALTQTAQVLVGPAQPVELAQIGSELSDHLTWGKVIAARAEPEPAPKSAATAETKVEIAKTAKAVAAKTGAKGRGPRGPYRPKRTKLEIDTFDARVLEVLRQHPASTIKRIAGFLGKATDPLLHANIRNSIYRMVSTGRVFRDRTVEPGGPHRYSATSASPASSTEEDHLESDSGSEPTGLNEESSPQHGGWGEADVSLG
jgi:hypothetical protein